MPPEKETNPNPQNQPLNYLSDKIERLSSALYMVTSYLNDNEPLKWQLRTEALNLLRTGKNITSEETTIGQQKTVFYKNLNNDNCRQSIKDILSLLVLGINSGSVSTMNFSLLKNEYTKLLDHVSQIEQDQLTKFTLAGFDYPALTPRGEETFSNKTETNLGGNLTAISYKDVPTNLGNFSSKKSSPSIGLHKTAKTGRQTEITNFVKGRGWVSITDIVTAVPGFSSKTIQRELSALVAKGQLRKKGDRRWSRYLMA